MQLTRIVIAQSRADKVSQMPNGAVRVDAVLSRAGVFEYETAEGAMVRELRPRDEVLNPESYKTFANMPVTVDHPQAGEVTPENWQGLAVGHIGDDLRVEGDAVIGSLYIHDAATARNVLGQALVELSPGYQTHMDDVAGVDDSYGAYDAVQRRIQYNHIALLPPGDGRQGSAVAVRLDSRRNARLDWSRKTDMDENQLKKLIVSDMPDMDAIVAAIAPKISEMIPALIAEQLALVAGPKTGEEDPALDAEDPGLEPAEEEVLDVDVEPKTLDAEDEKVLDAEEEKKADEFDRRVDRAVRDRLADLELFTDITGKKADVRKDSVSQLRDAAASAGFPSPKTASRPELVAYLHGYKASRSQTLATSPAGRADSAAPEDVTLTNPYARFSRAGDK